MALAGGALSWYVLMDSCTGSAGESVSDDTGSEDTGSDDTGSEDTNDDTGLW